MYALFNNMEEFNSWHNVIKERLAYPLIGINGSTGEPDDINLITEYTSPLINLNDIRVIAWVGEENTDLQSVLKEDYLEWFTVSNMTIPEDKLSDDNSSSV
jgi:hypothetical protein